MLYTNPHYMGAERSLDCGIASDIANCEVFLNIETYITVKFLSDIEYKTFKQAYALDFFSSCLERVDIIKLTYLPSNNIASKERP